MYDLCALKILTVLKINRKFKNLLSVLRDNISDVYVGEHIQ